MSEETLLVMNFTGAYEAQDFYKHSACQFLDCRHLTGVNGFCSRESEAVIDGLTAGLPGGIHFIDGGNFHYITYFMVRRIKEPFSLVVFDHHTDMQSSAFGGLLSCGCWLKRSLDENRYLKNVLLIGVADGLANASEAVRAAASGRLHILRESETADAWEWERGLKTLEKEAGQSIYVSIDKDALCRQEVVTDWDQGSMTLSQLETAWQRLAGGRRVFGVDICGEAERNYGAPGKMAEADKRNDIANARILKMIQST